MAAAPLKLECVGACCRHRAVSGCLECGRIAVMPICIPRPLPQIDFWFIGSSPEDFGWRIHLRPMRLMPDQSPLCVACCKPVEGRLTPPHSTQLTAETPSRVATELDLGDAGVWPRRFGVRLQAGAGCTCAVCVRGTRRKLKVYGLCATESLPTSST